MRLVVNAPYSSTTTWGDALLVSTSGSSVAAKRIVVDAATFSLTEADTTESVSKKQLMDSVVMSGTVSAVTCVACSSTDGSLSEVRLSRR